MLLKCRGRTDSYVYICLYSRAWQHEFVNALGGYEMRMPRSGRRCANCRQGNSLPPWNVEVTSCKSQVVLATGVLTELARSAALHGLPQLPHHLCCDAFRLPG